MVGGGRGGWGRERGCLAWGTVGSFLGQGVESQELLLDREEMDYAAGGDGERDGWGFRLVEACRERVR